MLIGEDQQGLRLTTPEHSAVQDAKAFAYVRPHDLEVTPYVTGASLAAPSQGLVAKLTRAMVVGPIARLELLPLDATAAGHGTLIEAHIPAQHFRDLGLKEGETVLLTPRRARVFVAEGEGI